MLTASRSAAPPALRPAAVSVRPGCRTEAACSRISLICIFVHKFLMARWPCAGVQERWRGRTSDQTQAMSSVWQLPPIESLSRCVSLDERYGTCRPPRLDNAMITCVSRGARPVKRVCTMPALSQTRCETALQAPPKFGEQGGHQRHVWRRLARCAGQQATRRACSPARGR